VQTQVSEADVSRLSPDMEAYFTTLGNRGKRWYGQLRKVEPTPTVTNNVVLYNALFDVPNEQRTLLPQMTAQVFFVAASAKDALFIPAAAVNTTKGLQRGGPGNTSAGSQPAAAQKSGESKPERTGKRDAKGTAAAEPQVWAGVTAQQRRSGGEAVVKAVNAAGKIEDRTIQTGISNRIHVQVLSGLSEGDQIVIGRKLPAGAPGAQASAGQRDRNALQTGGAPGARGMGGGPR